MKILLIQQKMIGDVLTSTLLCEHLKHQFPECRIDFVANDNTLAVLEGNPYINRVIVFKKEYKKNKIAFFTFLRTFRKTKYDVVIDAYGKTESNLITLFTPAKLKISYHKWYTRFLYTHPLKRDTASIGGLGLAVKNRLLLLSPLIKAEISLAAKPKIYLSKDEIERAALFLEQYQINVNHPLFMLSVLGSSISKTYPLPYMAEIIDTVAATTSATLLFNYLPEQKEQAKTLYFLCNEATRTQIRIDVFATSLRDFLGVLYHCAALLGNEGGAVNMAKAMGIPTFSIFSPWIKKEAWNVFSDEKNVAVHLSDGKPELFEGKRTKELKKNAALLYQEFKPLYIEDKLRHFLTTVLNTHKSRSLR
jgi:heptosyltransferase II